MCKQGSTLYAVVPASAGLGVGFTRLTSGSERVFENQVDTLRYTETYRHDSQTRMGSRFCMSSACDRGLSMWPTSRHLLPFVLSTAMWRSRTYSEVSGDSGGRVRVRVRVRVRDRVRVPQRGKETRWDEVATKKDFSRSFTHNVLRCLDQRDLARRVRLPLRRVSATQRPSKSLSVAETTPPPAATSLVRAMCLGWGERAYAETQHEGCSKQKRRPLAHKDTDA
jgi:hypothetical protein